VTDLTNAQPEIDEEIIHLLDEFDSAEAPKRQGRLTEALAAALAQSRGRSDIRNKAANLAWSLSTSAKAVKHLLHAPTRTEENPSGA